MCLNSGDRGKVRERACLDGCSAMIYNYAWLGAVLRTTTYTPRAPALSDKGR